MRKIRDRKIQRLAERHGKEKGVALERRADKRVQPPPPFKIQRFANPGRDEGAPGSSRSPHPTFCLESRPPGAG